MLRNAEEDARKNETAEKEEKRHREEKKLKEASGRPAARRAERALHFAQTAMIEKILYGLPLSSISWPHLASPYPLWSCDVH